MTRARITVDGAEVGIVLRRAAHKGGAMHDVLIVGAGPTGLTLASELIRRDIDVRLIDAVDGPFEGARGKGIQPRSLEIFDMMGIVDELLSYGSLYPFGGNTGGGRGAVECLLVRPSVALDHAGNPGRRPGTDRAGRLVY